MIYSKHGVFGFATSVKTSIGTIACSLLVYNFVYFMVHEMFPAREHYTRAVSKTKSGLIRSRGKVSNEIASRKPA